MLYDNDPTLGASNRGYFETQNPVSPMQAFSTPALKQPAWLGSFQQQRNAFQTMKPWSAGPNNTINRGDSQYLNPTTGQWQNQMPNLPKQPALGSFAPDKGGPSKFYGQNGLMSNYQDRINNGTLV